MAAAMNAREAALLTENRDILRAHGADLHQKPEMLRRYQANAQALAALRAAAEAAKKDQPQ